MTNILSEDERKQLLSELGVPEDVASTTTTTAPPVIVEQVEQEPEAAPATVGYSVTPVDQLPITKELFEGVSMRTSDEIDKAYRKVFDQYKQPRKLFPGYNKDLTKRIRKAMKEARPEPTGHVKAQARKSTQANDEAYSDLVATVTQAVLEALKK